MISKIKGKLVKKEECRVYLEAGDFIYEVLTPKSAYLRLDDYLKDGELQLSIYYYFYSDQHKFHPMLIGFLSELEKEFFEKIIKVSGIGPKAALQALNKPISEIALAIENGDLAYLRNLPRIGLQKAKNIIAFLQGKMGKFTLIKDKVEERREDSEQIHTELSEEAENVLVQLQYKKREAKEMIKRALKANPEIRSLEDLLNQIYRQKA